MTDFKNKRNDKGNEFLINIPELLPLYRSKWYWFLISFIIVFGGAIIYLSTFEPVYSSSASLLIIEKSDNKSSINNQISNSFSEMNSSVSKSNVQNERFILLSSSLMMEVVKQLHLDMNYFLEDGFRKKTIYGSTLPVNVVINNSSDIYGSFTMNILSNGDIELFDFKNANGETYKEEVLKCKFNNTIDSPLGKLTVLPTRYYKKDSGYKIYVSRSDLFNTTKKYMSNLKVSIAEQKATILDLTFKDICIQRAVDILSTLISIYNVNWIKDKNQIAASTSGFINGRLKIIKNELQNVDKEISSFKSKNLLPDIQAASSMYLVKNEEMGTQIMTLNNQLYMANFIQDYLKKESNKNLLLPVNTGIENNSVNLQISEYNTKQLLRNNLVKNSSEENPLVKNIDQSLNAIRNAIIASIDNRVINLQSQLKNLQQNEKEVTNNLANSPTQAEYLISIERQQKIKESIYLFLLQKREENELLQAFSAYNTKVINPPSGNTNPISSSKKLILIFAFFMGIGIPALILFTIKYVDTSVHGKKDFEGMSIPFIGEIPLFNKNKIKLPLYLKKEKHEFKPYLKVKEGERDIINEAFRIVRMNLEFIVSKDEGANVITLSSFIHDSGKTFLTLNVAVSLAISGKKVLVIDGDLRSASMSEYINSPQKGISNFLSNQIINPDDIIVTDKIYENLKFIPVGTIPPNPTELLMGNRLGQLLEVMRKRYDYIFIDCPPIDIIADTSIIEKSADRMIFVIRARLANQKMLSELDDIYKEQRYKNMSVVLNGTTKEDSRYAYKYSYYKGYYGKYGK